MKYFQENFPIGNLGYPKKEFEQIPNLCLIQSLSITLGLAIQKKVYVIFVWSLLQWAKEKRLIIR